MKNIGIVGAILMMVVGAILIMVVRAILIICVSNLKNHRDQSRGENKLLPQC